MLRTCVFLCLLACCTSKTTTGPCAQRSGNYVVDITARSGNCGQHVELIATVGESASPDPPCTGSNSYSADNCSESDDETCPDTNHPGYHDEVKGTVNWSQDGKTGGGIVELRQTDANGAVVCMGTYDYSATKAQ